MRKLFTAAIALLGTINVQAYANEQIHIAGSSTIFPFAASVAEHVGKTAGIKTPIVESTGTGGGFKLFCSSAGEDASDISNASRPIKESEIDNCKKNGITNVAEIIIGYDGIVLASSITETRMSLTEEQIWRALAKNVFIDGKIIPNPHKKWSDIAADLPAQPIRVYGPSPTSGTRDAFIELIMDKGCAVTPEIAALQDADEKKALCGNIREDGAYIEAGENDNLIVQKLVADKQSLGIFGYSFLDENSDKVQANLIQGMEPTYESISSKTYPAARSLYFYVKLNNIDRVPGIREYIEEFLSERAIGEDGYLIDKGLIPLEKSELAKIKANAFKPIF